MNAKDLASSNRFAESPEDFPSREEVIGLTGLEYMRAIRDGRFVAAPIARTLGFVLDEVEEGRAVFRGRPRFDVYNPLGGAHGGWYGTMLDSCMACAVHTALPKGRSYTTLEYKVNLVRAATEAVGEVLAIGTTLHVGRRTATAEGRMVGAEDGKLYATGTTTCLILEL
jgi:uncharacterized protein (TIGR00369 family)